MGKEITQMFSKILIANRGEIACRVMRTAQDMGIKTVAVYSDADENALHVEMADEAVHIGPSAALESYLNIEKIVGAAKRCGAGAIHPGYGFLSENPEFVEAVEAVGLVFIGPSADAIRAMGLKDAAKVLMEKSGVPVVPGYHGDNQDAGFLAAEAAKTGYPVLIKARAGGGGKGMRVVERAADFKAALEGARREGEASFGDGHVLIEKFISCPRHIEIQVFGDNHGHVVHMFERDCSLQRRHQKVIEEAPAPGMNEEMRSAMGEAAVNAAKAVNYSGAGTVEFIVDGSEGLRPDRFWFMEMNTRLQVEHPVTEMITGLDLVELQLRVASGEALPFAQQDLSFNGWAFEARIYAEDAANGFLPSVGELGYFRMPEQLARVDCGVKEGGQISPYYDPMIGKIIVHGSDRRQALSKLSAALNKTYIGGVTTNVAFLAALCQNDDFASGGVDTGLIDREIDALTAHGEAKDVDIGIGALLAIGGFWSDGDGISIGQFENWRQWGSGKSYVDLIYKDQQFSCSVARLGDGSFGVKIDENGPELRLELEFENNMPSDKVRVSWHGGTMVVASVVSEKSVTIIGGAKTHVFDIVDPLEKSACQSTNANTITAPMPGLVKSVKVKAGDSVKQGQVLAILEAMKMEHSLGAPRDGEIENVHIDEGEQVEDAALLVSLVEERAE